MRNGVWRRLCPKAVNSFKGFEPITINIATVTLAKEIGFVEADEDDIEGLDIPWPRTDRGRVDAIPKGKDMNWNGTQQRTP